MVCSQYVVFFLSLTKTANWWSREKVSGKLVPQKDVYREQRLVYVLQSHSNTIVTQITEKVNVSFVRKASEHSASMVAVQVVA